MMRTSIRPQFLQQRLAAWSHRLSSTTASKAPYSMATSSLVEQDSFMAKSSSMKNHHHHRVAFGSIMTTPTKKPTEIRTFASSSPSSNAKQILLDILAREEVEEKESGNVAVPDDLRTIQKSLEADWRIVDEGAMTQLFLKQKKVQISFHCQDTVEAFQDDVDDEEADEEELVNPVRFTVTVAKAGKTLVFQCLSEYGEVKVESVATTSLAPDVVHANQGILAKTDYQGPEFVELAEDLQDAVGDYLEEECHVNADVATFVAMYSDFKEQSQYVQFLKDVQSIIS